MAHRILYDGQCAFCRWSLAWILRWDRHREVEPVALQDPAAADLLSPLDEEGRMASWHLVDDDGRVTSGGRAAIPLLRVLPGGRALAALGERVPGAVERGYAWVNRNRGDFGGRLTSGAVERADRVIARRRGPRQAGAR